MENVSILGVDVSKRVFHVHGAARDGSVVFRKKLSRSQFAQMVRGLPRCVIAMEACASAHFWGRTFNEYGHEVRLIPPVYAKKYIKRLACPHRVVWFDC